MRRILILISIQYLLVTTQLLSQIKFPENNNVNGWVKNEAPRVFKKTALFNHINGGAELFHEFGFDELVVQYYKKESDEIAIEIYKMESPTSALGIYLMKCGKETPINGIVARNSGNRFQSTIFSGVYFIQINNFSGNEKNIPVVVQCAQFLLSQVKTNNQIKVFSYLPPKNLIPGSERIIRGKYGLESIYTFGQGDMLKLNRKIFAIVGDYNIGGDRAYTQLIVLYPDDMYANDVFNSLKENLDPYLEIIQQDQTKLVFKDYQSKYGVIEIKKNIIQINIQLEKRP
jgi:hypothetical protein